MTAARVKPYTVAAALYRAVEDTDPGDPPNTIDWSISADRWAKGYSSRAWAQPAP